MWLVDALLKDGSPVQLALAGQQDSEPQRTLCRIIVDEGTSYPHDGFPDRDDFMDLPREVSCRGDPTEA